MMIFANIRFWVLLVSFTLAIAIYFYTTSVYSGYLQALRLLQFYALTSVTYLYIALLVSPVTRFFKFLPYRGQYLKARRAIGFSAMIFASLHALFAFFTQIGGFAGFFSLGGITLIAVLSGELALIILITMASTSFDKMVEKLTFPVWKTLHRFVYIAGFLILFHAVMLGEHFQDLSGTIPTILFVALAFLLILEAVRFYKYLQERKTTN